MRRRPIFTVQKHDATRLHYDFRLEMGGALKSWAIPKGPSMDPSVKRLAVQVDDHDLEYADFEGVIEEGHYGAGPVLVWDSGWYEPLGTGDSPPPSLEAGKLDFALHGRRLKGRFSLIAMRGRPGHWLLVKRSDQEALPGHDLTDDATTSVLTGRTIKDLQREAEEGALETARCGTSKPSRHTGRPHAKK